MMRTAAIVTLGAAMVACTPTEVDGSGSGGSGAGSTSSSGGTGGTSPTYDGYGSVTAFNYHYTSPSEVIVAGAAASFSQPDGTSCVHNTVSSCEIYDCPAGGTATPQVSAGVVGVQGGSVDISLTPEADGTY